MAYLSNTPGQFNHWNYTDENDFYSPVQNAGNLSDEKQWGKLKEQDFYEFARANGYTGKKENVIPALLGMVNPVTGEGEVKFGDYNSGGATSTAFGQIQYPLMQYLQNNDPDLWAQFQAGKHYSPDFTAGDLIAYGIAGGMTGMAGLSTLGTAGAGAATSGMSAADIAGLTQMGMDAGLSGGALDAFVASGGTLGSTAAGGGGVLGGGMLDSGGAFDYSFDGTGIEPGSGVDPSGFPTTGGTPTGGISLPDLSKIPASVWSQGAQAVLKYIGMNKMGKAYEDAANRFFAMSAPFQAKLLESYGPKFNLYDNPAYRKAFGRAADISTRQWSARSGNPANNPGIQASILDDVWTKSYLPALSDYRSGLMGGSSLGVNSATNALVNSIPYSQPGLSAGGDFLGGILNQPTQPKQDDKQTITIGGVPYRI